MTTETWMDKSGWGDGPWQAEPDRAEFEAHGFSCLAKRNHMGVWCGYVAIPPGHPWHGKRYDSVDPEVHGGLTYSAPCQDDDRPKREQICHVPKPGEPDDVWWLGFDCGHGGDLMPSHNEFSKFSMPGKYRDLAYAKAECESLAKQASNAK